MVKKFVKGVFELRTPRPKYDSIWDVSIVFDYMKSLGDNNCLSLKGLTLKTATFSISVGTEMPDVTFFKYGVYGKV